MMKLIKKYFELPRLTRNRRLKAFIFKKLFAKLTFRFFNNYRSVLYLSYRPDFDWRFNEFENSKQLHEIWGSSDDMGLKWGDLPRLYFLYSTIQYIISKNIPGAFAEVGVYRGNFAKVMHILAPDRKLYLFDTFEGYNKDDLNLDPYDYSGWEESFKNTSLQHVKDFVGEDNTAFYKGRFPETSAQVPEDETFALVHLDCDIYMPTKSGLEYFYPRMVKGGVMIVHDYKSGLWPGITKAVDEFFVDKPESPVIIPDASGSAAISINK